MNMKKKCQHQKESKQINAIIIHLQAHIRGYLVRKEIKNKFQYCNKQELYASKIQVRIFSNIFYYMIIIKLSFQKWWRCILFRRKLSALLKEVRKQLKPFQRVYTRCDVSNEKIKNLLFKLNEPTNILCMF